MIYRQKETFPIKNSYMNEVLGQPQTFQKRNIPIISFSVMIKYLLGKLNMEEEILINL